MTAVIQVEGLRKTLRRPGGWRDLLRPPKPQVVLAGIDLSVQRGEIFGLLGPNGAGKTTLVKILAGLLLPDGGRALVDGYDVREKPMAVRRAVGVAYGDERSFYWRLSIVENLRFYASLYRLQTALAERRIAELLEILGLTEVARTRMYALSSGMRQRAAIARSLIHDPAILLMDEPTRSLDPVGADDVRRLIRDRVAKSGRTVLIATNQMSEAEALCDRLTLIDHGLTVVAGTVADFRRYIDSDLRYRLLVSGGQTGWQRGLQAIPGVFRVLLDQGVDGLQAIEVTMDHSGSALPRTIRHLVDQEVEIQSCSRQEWSLDEIFRGIVRQRRTAAEVESQ